jgi:hypothetical protein
MMVIVGHYGARWLEGIISNEDIFQVGELLHKSARNYLLIFVATMALHSGMIPSPNFGARWLSEANFVKGLTRLEGFVLHHPWQPRSNISGFYPMGVHLGLASNVVAVSGDLDINQIP